MVGWTRGLLNLFATYRYWGSIVAIYSMVAFMSARGCALGGAYMVCVA